jgi:glycosyltransferase involved in cell wall biosynthesis
VDHPGQPPKPEVSVLMPVYNAARFLRPAIESILSQSLQEFEFIIVDDGSTDDSTDIIAAYARDDSRIRVLRHESNRGIVQALNAGLSICGGEFVARMDADDVALPDRLADQVKKMAENPAIAALGGAVTYIDASGKELGLIRQCNVHASPLAGSPLLHPSVTLRRSLLVEHQLHYRERYRYAEDYFLWLELQRYGLLDALENVVIQYRITETTSRRQHLKQMMRAALRVKRDAILILGFKPQASDLVRMMSESLLLLMPSRLIWRLYQRINRIVI